MIHGNDIHDNTTNFTDNGTATKKRDNRVALAWEVDTVSIIKDADADTKVDVEEAADEDIIRMDVAAVEAFNLNAVGILTLAKQSSCGAKNTASQSIPNATWTKLQFPTEEWDVQNEFDPTTNHRFTATVAGKYLCSVSCGFPGLADGTRIIIDIQKNGATTARLLDVTFGGLAYGPGGSASVVDCAANDYLEGFVYQTHGSAQNTDVGTNFFRVAKVA